MGLLAEVQTMNIRQARKEQEEKEKEQKRLEQIKKIEEKKRQEKEKKQYEKDLLKAIENDLKSCFQKCFERDGLVNGYINLRLVATRKEIIQNVGTNFIEQNYIDQNYEKVLEKVKKIYENNEKAKNELLQMQLLEEQTRQEEIETKKRIEQQEKEKKKNIFFNIIYYIGQTIKWLFIIVFGGIYLIFKFIAELANKMY